MLELIIYILNLFVTTILALWVIKIWRHYPNNSLKYLMLAMLMFIIDTIFPIIEWSLDQTFDVYLFRSISSLITVLWAFYALVLFFETFYSASPFNKITIIFGIMAVISTVGGIIIGIAISTTQMVLFPGVIDLEGVNVIQSLNPEAKILAEIHLVMIISNGFLVWVFMAFNIIQVTRRIRTDKYIHRKPKTKRMLYEMALGMTIILLGSFMLVNESIIGELTVFLGYSYIYIRYLSGGVFLLQKNSLQRLLIINNIGTPVYSFDFISQQVIANNQQSESDSQDKTNEDVLFSGALQAISMLLGQLTGSNQHLREIVFDDIYLLIHASKKHEISFILVANQITHFYRDALRNFARSIPEQINLTQVHQMLEIGEIKKADDLVIKYFGQ